MFKKAFFIIFVGVLIQSCSYLKPKQDSTKKLVAKVNNAFLYQDDIKIILPKKYTANDSAILVSNYINSWAKQQLLFDMAVINLKEEQKEIQKLVDKYRQDLLINKYKEAIVSQELDTLIVEEDIDNFYNENKEIFKLNEKLIKFKFIQISKDVLDLDRVKKLFKSDKNEDILELEANELVYKSFHLNDSTWIKYSDVLKLVPIIKIIESKITDNNYFQKEDDVDLYLIKINKTLSRNKLAPKSYVKPTIKQMILHSRKLLLLKNIEKTLLNDATKNGKYEVYK